MIFVLFNTNYYKLHKFNLYACVFVRWNSDPTSRSSTRNVSNNIDDFLVAKLIIRFHIILDTWIFYKLKAADHQSLPSHIFLDSILKLPLQIFPWQNMQHRSK